jgi:hypothetical protein
VPRKVERTGIDALTAAFMALLPLAAPERAERVLRHGIAALVASDDRPLVSRSPPIAEADVAAWDRIKAEVRGSGVKLVDLARAIDVPVASLQKTLSPAGRPGGRILYDKLAAWLAAPARSEGRGAPEAGEGITLADENAPAAHRPPDEAASRPPPTPPAPPPGPRRLTADERTQLRAAFGGLDDRALRRALNCSGDLFSRALVGAELPGEVVARLVGALGYTNGAGPA